jgi:hypothetical protein
MSGAEIACLVIGLMLTVAASFSGSTRLSDRQRTDVLPKLLMAAGFAFLAATVVLVLIDPATWAVM